MKLTTIILLGIAMAAYRSARSVGTERSWFQNLKGWQRVFGMVALVLAVLILLNPEFVALGLLGDAAFFDLLVAALALHMHTYATSAGRCLVRILASGVRCLGIPSPGLLYLLGVSTVAIGSAVSIFQKVVHRIVSI